MKDDRIDDRPQTTARGDYSDRQRPSVRTEVRRDQCHAGQEQAAGAQTDAETLREEDLPVLHGEAGHHGTEDGEKCAGDDEGAEVASVEEWAHDKAERYEEESLEGANPGYLRGAVVFGEGCSSNRSGRRRRY